MNSNTKLQLRLAKEAWEMELALHFFAIQTMGYGSRRQSIKNRLKRLRGNITRATNLLKKK